MNELISDLFRRIPLQYVAIDEALAIREFTNGAPALADKPEAVLCGHDARIGFPELVGSEKDLERVRKRIIPNIRYRGLQRNVGGGPPRYVSVTIEPTHGESDQKTLIIRLEDVTEFLELQQRVVQESNEVTLLHTALSASNLYLEKILDSIGDILLVVDIEGTIKTVNRAALDVLEVDVMDIQGKPLENFIGSETAGHIKTFAKESLEEEILNTQTSCRTGTGEDIPVLLSVSRIVVNGKVEVILSGKNLQEIMKAEEEIHHLHEENDYLHEEIRAEHNFEEIIGASSGMKKVFRKVQRVASTDSTVLLRGETGTGKELIARAVHNLSGRREKSLIKVNCAALPSGLVESELFGHEKGAFTGATSKRIGRFELAHEATIFLDEVGELPLETQSKLLRVLQEQQLERVGGSATITVNVRVIAATNRDLEDAVKVGGFREDLFYRLNVFPIQVPSLREREDDIPMLAQFFIEQFARKMGKKIPGVDRATMKKLVQYSWPGNVRELANVLERAVILSDHSLLRPSDIQLAKVEGATKSDRSLGDIERDHIISVLNKCDGKIEGKHGAAIRLRINPGTLRSRLKKLGIRRKGLRFVSSRHP